ncbi:MAG: LysM peptidoglycan-binding domain-containing protein [Candidatus Omnitrophota bacterium]
MYNKTLLFSLGCFVIFIVGGCVVRTYPVIKERADQDLARGNRGFLMGKKDAFGTVSDKKTRRVQVVEVEFHSIKHPIQFEAGAQPLDSAVSEAGVESKPGFPLSDSPVIKSVIIEPVNSNAMVTKKYTIKKGDTLQIISMKFYGTTKRWNEIYQANRALLKSPDSVYPGQVIEIPVEDVSGVK